MSLLVFILRFPLSRLLVCSYFDLNYFCRSEMSSSDLMHPRSVFRTKPNFALLAEKYPEFKEFCSLNIKNKLKYDFKNREAMRVLSQTLLEHYFGLKTCIPSNKLIPTVPLRLNYILWIEDLINLLPNESNSENRQVRGIDIGCGSCAIYMLLGAKVHKWKFLGLCLESDYENVHSSLENISLNDLNDRIEVQRVENGYALSDILDPSSTWTFCLTNPPFYDTDTSSEAGSANECSTPGGETSVISTLIDHSLIVGPRVQWYTALVGIKKNLAPLKQRLSAIEAVRRVETTEFRQGKTWRWGLAWTFCDNVSAPLPNYSSKKRNAIKPNDKSVCKPVEWSIAVNEFANLMHLDKDLEKFQSISQMAQELLKDLSDVVVESISDIPSCLKLKLVAKKVTWIHSRRQRRANKKSKESPEKMEQELDKDFPTGNEESCLINNRKLKRSLIGVDHLSVSTDVSFHPPVSKVRRLEDENVAEDLDSGISFETSKGTNADSSLSPKEQISSPSFSDTSFFSDEKEIAKDVNEEMVDEDALSCSIVFKLAKQSFVMTFSTVHTNQKESLNSLMLYVKGAINRYKDERA